MTKTPVLTPALIVKITPFQSIHTDSDISSKRQTFDNLVHIESNMVLVGMGRGMALFPCMCKTVAIVIMSHVAEMTHSSLYPTPCPNMRGNFQNQEELKLFSSKGTQNYRTHPVTSSEKAH